MTLAYDICNICGKMYEKTGKQYCGSCSKENDREYRLVLDYIESHPVNTILEIITQTKVSVKTINRFIEEGIISYKEGEEKF